MKIATWNVNSVRARLPRLVPWLQEHQPDVLCMQETKVEDTSFPSEPLEDEGYNVEYFGEPNYNGVAILSRYPMEGIVKGFPDDAASASRRMIACVVRDLIVVNVYVPNGKALDDPKFEEKMAWLDQLRGFLDTTYDPREKLVLTGDFNITFDDRDVWDPDGMRDAIHCSPRERQKLAHVMAFGLTDGLRRFHEQAGMFTWWHHRGAGFQRDRGMRIDHFLMTDAALEACSDVWIDDAARAGRAPSDHAPVFAQLSG